VALDATAWRLGDLAAMIISLQESRRSNRGPSENPGSDSWTAEESRLHCQSVNDEEQSDVAMQNYAVYSDMSRKVKFTFKRLHYDTIGFTIIRRIGHTR